LLPNAPRIRMLALVAVMCLLLPEAPTQGAPGATPLDPVPVLVAFTPASVEIDPEDGSLWIVDRYLPRVAHLEADGTLVAVFPASRYGGGRPSGIAFEGPTGAHLFISDPDSRRVVRIDRNGNAAGSFSTDPFGMTDPADLAWDVSTSALWVADPLAQQVFQLRPRDSDADGLPDVADLVGSFSTLPLGSGNPMGMARDPVSGHLFLSDPALDRVFEVTAGGALVDSFDSGYQGGTSVTGLAWDAGTRNLLLSDAGRKVLTMTADGALLGTLGTAAFGSLSPKGLTWDPATGTLTVVTGERKMIRFQPDEPDGSGSFGGILLWRQEWTTTFTSIAPTGIALDPATGDRFVSDSLQHRVFRVDGFGGVISSFDTGAEGSFSPTGLSIGPGGGSLFLSDSQAREIIEVSLTGVQISSFSTSPFKKKPHSEPLCNDPEGVAYDAARDHLFVVDPLAQRVFEVTRDGSFIAAFSTAPTASYPTDLAVDPAGDRLIVSDSSGHLVEFSRSGVFRGSYPAVPLQVRIPEASGLSVERETLHRIVTDPLVDAVFFLSSSGAALGQISLEPYGIRSPSGAAWSREENRLYVVDQVAQELFDISPGADGAFGSADDTIASLSTVAYGSGAPRGVILDRVLGRVGWGDEESHMVVWVTTTFAYAGSVDLGQAAVTALRGIDQDPTSQDLFISDPSAGILTTTSIGGLVQAMPTSEFGIGDPGGLGFSPAEGALLVVDRSDRTLVPVDLRAFLLQEVQGLTLDDTGQTSWLTNPVFSGYQLFRGTLSQIPEGLYGGCFWVGPGPPTSGGETPTQGEGWSYLVVGTNPTGVGSLGKSSGGTERPLSSISPSCP
jgi:DNA-binding beta-propeller fold protein YncE